MADIQLILTHPGGAHKDDFLASCVLMAKYRVPLVRREPTDSDLTDPSICVVDVGDQHSPELHNFDHHHFPREADPVCALSIVLQHLGIYEDARLFCEWLETAEWFDCRGAKGTAEWLGVEREVVSKLVSPVDVTLLNRFAKCSELKPGDLLYEVMQWVGEDLLTYLRTMRERLSFIGEHGAVWEVETSGSVFTTLYIPRTDPLPDEPSMGIGRYIEEQGLKESVVGLIYPDRRGEGFALSRYEDHRSLDFTRIEGEEDVRFAHRQGFVAKVDATDPERLRELMAKAWKAV